MSLDFLHKKLFLRFPLLLVVFETMPLLRRLVGGFSPQRPDFDFRPTRAGFVMDKVVQGQTFLRVLRCFQSMLFRESYLLTNLLPPQYVSN